MPKKTHLGPDLNSVRHFFILFFFIFIFFFFKNLVSSVTRYYGQLSSCTISEKTNDTILRKFNDGQTDGQADVGFIVISK